MPERMRGMVTAEIPKGRVWRTGHLEMGRDLLSRDTASLTQPHDVTLVQLLSQWASPLAVPKWRTEGTHLLMQSVQIGLRDGEHLRGRVIWQSRPILNNARPRNYFQQFLGGYCN